MNRSLATNYYVNVTGSDAAGKGTASGTPAATTQWIWKTYGPLGTNALTYGDTIFIAAGTYTATTDCKMDITVAGLTFKGAGVGVTIFDHKFYGAAGNSDYFMWIKANDTHLHDMSITRFDGGAPNSGLVYNTINCGAQALTLGSATGILLDNVQVHDNGGNGNAAIVVNKSTTAIIRNGGSTCNAEGSTYSGGLDVLGDNINLTIENYLLAYNSKSAFEGAGLYVFGDNTTTVVNVWNSNFSYNTGYEGTGLYVKGGNVTFRNGIIGNNTTSGGTYGGGVTIYKGIVKITNSKIISNSGNKGGGIAAYSNNGAITLTIDSCYFSGNSASASKGVDLYARPSATYSYAISGIQNTFTTSTSAVCSYDGSGNPCGTMNFTQTVATSTTSSQCTVNFSGSSSYTPNPSPSYPSGTCTITPILILPIELSVFEGICNANKTMIVWQTATEINNDVFTIERSSDGVNFKSIGTVKGAGNSSKSNNYHFTDTEHETGGAYYRLRQTDHNGTQSMSKIIYLDPCGTENTAEISIHPNPASISLGIDLKLPENTFVKTEILNAIGGQISQTENRWYETGLQTLELDVSSLEQGVYFIKISLNEKETIHKFIKM